MKELTVAVKLAKFEELSSSTIETIIEEANCLSVLRHERIVRVSMVELLSKGRTVQDSSNIV